MMHHLLPSSHPAITFGPGPIRVALPPSGSRTAWPKGPGTQVSPGGQTAIAAHGAALTRRDPYRESCTVQMAEVRVSNLCRCRRISPESPARAALIASSAAAASRSSRTWRKVPPLGWPLPTPTAVSAAARGLGLGEHHGGRLGDLDDDPAREGRSRLALGRTRKLDQRRDTAGLMIVYLIGEDMAGNSSTESDRSNFRASAAPIPGTKVPFLRISRPVAARTLGTGGTGRGQQPARPVRQP